MSAAKAASPAAQWNPILMLMRTGHLGAAAFLLCGSIAVGAVDLGWLFLFGAVNLGAGLAMFVTGARLVPAALVALVSNLEPVLGPVWVWLVHGEVPAARTLLGGGIVFVALLVHILTDRKRREEPAPVSTA